MATVLHRQKLIDQTAVLRAHPHLSTAVANPFVSAASSYYTADSCFQLVELSPSTPALHKFTTRHRLKAVPMLPKSTINQCIISKNKQTILQCDSCVCSTTLQLCVLSYSTPVPAALNDDQFCQNLSASGCGMHLTTAQHPRHECALKWHILCKFFKNAPNLQQCCWQCSAAENREAIASPCLLTYHSDMWQLCS